MVLIVKPLRMECLASYSSILSHNRAIAYYFSIVKFLQYVTLATSTPLQIKSLSESWSQILMMEVMYNSAINNGLI